MRSRENECVCERVRVRESERETRRPRGSFLVSVPRDFRRPERVELWPPPEKVPKTFLIDRKKTKKVRPKHFRFRSKFRLRWRIHRSCHQSFFLLRCQKSVEKK